MCRSSLCYITTFISLVTISLVMVEIYVFNFNVLIVNLRMEARQGDTPRYHV